MESFSLFISLLPRNVDESALRHHIERELEARVTEMAIHPGRRSDNRHAATSTSTITAHVTVEVSWKIDPLLGQITTEMLDGLLGLIPKDEIPSEFVDPISCSWMNDPVLLPTSNKIVDRSTIERHCENDLKDPFNQEDLRTSMVIPATQLKQQSIQWILQKSTGHIFARRLTEVPFQNQTLLVQPSSRSSTNTSKQRKNRGDYSNKWETAQTLATEFHKYIFTDGVLLQRASDREELTSIFQNYLAGGSSSASSSSSSSKEVINEKQMERFVMTLLRQRKLLKSKRHGHKVIMVFAPTPGHFPEISEQNEERERVLLHHVNLEKDKFGVTIEDPANKDEFAASGKEIHFEFVITQAEASTELELVEIGGRQSGSFHLLFPTMQDLPTDDIRNLSCRVKFVSSGPGIYRCHVTMRFRSMDGKLFNIRRHLLIRSGNAALRDVLKPTSPYQRKEHTKASRKPRETFSAPPKAKQSPGYLSTLPYYLVPNKIRKLSKDEMALLISEKAPPDQEDSLPTYASFWQHLLWTSEQQAYKDIQLYDMDDTKLKREGRMFVLYVPGLAENRPSVLKGDIVNASWNDRRYKGLVREIRQLDVLLEFHPTFHRSFNTSLDTVDIRFTFGRTIFRTAHEGAIRAPKSMGSLMLFPEEDHLFFGGMPRSLTSSIHFANSTLNQEQQDCINNILKAECRPMPYIIFGPPGTGKTTTLTEAVYQLVLQSGICAIRVLLVAPSNDAADILIEKLAPYFPPSEMVRVLAYSRSVDDVSSAVRPYVKPGELDEDQQLQAILSSSVVVSTVNLAARFVYFGVPKGHFDVLCMDEAGHATEPEVIAVASTLMDFTRRDDKVGQLVLAGDPKQLGPVVTSSICKTFGLATSYMERLFNSNVYQKSHEGNEYPVALITKLVQNYRSHPAIIKLPNEMFYDNELQNSGDRLRTHSMARWEHLPKPSFPVVFHAVHGENLREGSSPSWFNPQEAELVVHYVDLLVNQSRPPVQMKDIGIITPYTRQAQKIRKALETKGICDIKVGSVETFQGQERRCIILSSVRAQSELVSSDLKYNLGFVANEKRFNVAITRAQALLIVVGNPNVLATDKMNWLKLLRFCKENGSWAGEPWEEGDIEDDESTGILLDEAKIVSAAEEWEIVDYPSQAVEQEGLGYINREE